MSKMQCFVPHTLAEREDMCFLKFSYDNFYKEIQHFRPLIHFICQLLERHYLCFLLARSFLLVDLMLEIQIRAFHWSFDYLGVDQPKVLNEPQITTFGISHCASHLAMAPFKRV